jgi:HD-like signal output (HDOD) protein
MTSIDWTQLREASLKPFSLASLPATLKLPALPSAVAAFIKKSRDPKADLKDLARIVETDTGLTLELLKYINASQFGLRQKAKTALQAISMLGLRQTKLVVIATGAQAAVRSRRSKLFSPTCYWNSCVQRALFAREIAGLLKTDVDLAFAGALLQDFLLPVLGNEMYEPYKQFIELRQAQPECLIDFEQTRFGWDHALAAACLAHRWELPDELVCCIFFHHRGLRILADSQLARSPVAAVALSALLPDQLRQNYTGLEQLALLQTKWPTMNLPAIIQRVDDAHRELSLDSKIEFPLSRRCKPILDRMANQGLSHEALTGANRPVN